MTQALTKVPQLKSGNDGEVAAQLQSLFNDAQNGLRRVVALGMFCFHIKAQLPHGQFQPWLAANCESVSYRSLAGYMDLTENVLEACGVKTIEAFHQKCNALHFSNGSELLLLPESKLPEAAKPLREKICSLIDGKSQRALFLEFKQVDEENNPKKGNLSSKGRVKQISPEAALEAQRVIVREDIEAAMDAINAVQAKFTLLSDSKADALLLESYQAALERSNKAVSLWKNKPADKRDPKKVEELFK